MNVLKMKSRNVTEQLMLLKKADYMYKYLFIYFTVGAQTTVSGSQKCLPVIDVIIRYEKY